MTTLVKQQTNHDCVLACACMALNVSYETLEKRLPALCEHVREKGASQSMEFLIYEEFNLVDEIDFHMLTCKDRNVGFDISFKWALWGRRAMLTIPSKNIEGGYHAVYWNGKQFFDPCLKLTYNWNEVTKIVSATLFSN